MTTAETSAPSFDPSLAESAGGILRKWVAPFAVAIALLSAFLTFVVLSGLTPTAQYPRIGWPCTAPASPAPKAPGGAVPRPRRY